MTKDNRQTDAHASLLFVGVDWLQSIPLCAYMERRGYCCLYHEQGSPEPQYRYNQQFPRSFIYRTAILGIDGAKTVLAYEAEVKQIPFFRVGDRPISAKLSM